MRMTALFVVLGLILGAVAIQVYRAVGDFVEAARWVTHTFEVKQEIGATVAVLRDIEASQRAYIISGNQQRLADYYGNVPRIGERLARLKVLVADNPVQTENADTLATLFGTRTEGMDEVLALFREQGLEAVRASTQLTRSLEEDQRIEDQGERMRAFEDTLMTERQHETNEQATLTRLLTVGAIFICMVILGVALVVVLREQRRRLYSEARVHSANAELAGSLDESQRLGRTLRQLSELGEMLQGCRSMDEAVNGLRTSLPRLLPDHSGSLNLINASQNLVEAVTSWGEPPVATETLFTPDDCWALRRGQAYPLAGTTPAFTCKHLHMWHDPSICDTHLCVPLIAQGEMLGILTFSAARPIGEESRTVALAAGEQVSLAIANLILQETLRTQSLRDPLTGLFNRRYLEASLEREMQRASRRQQPMSVLMLDIDHFKRFNDSHGHDAGDALLAQFGGLLGRIVRTEDVACRYGGEEFTIVLHETDAEHAMLRAEEICTAVRSLDVQHRRQTLGPITISIGVATFPQHGTSPDELLRSADRALYAAKHAGRDHARLAA